MSVQSENLNLFFFVHFNQIFLSIRTKTTFKSGITPKLILPGTLIFYIFSPSSTKQSFLKGCLVTFLGLSNHFECEKSPKEYIGLSFSVFRFPAYTASRSTAFGRWSNPRGENSGVLPIIYLLIIEIVRPFNCGIRHW